MGLIRIILAVMIVLWHGGSIWGYRYMDPKVSIHAFYIISGFYMAFVLHEKYMGKGSYWLFLGNRLLRIYPVYIAIMLLTLLTYPLLRLMHADTLLDPIIGRVGIVEFITNITIVLSTSYFSLNARDPIPLIVPPAWTLGLEILFYTLAPFIVRLRLRYLLILSVASIVIRKLLLYPLFISGAFVPNRFIGTEICFFLMGVSSYALLARIAYKRSVRLQAFLYGTLVVTTVLYQYAATVQPSFVEWGYYGLVTITMPFIFWYTKHNRIDRFIGSLSYPVYLSNMLIIWLLKPWLGAEYGDMSNALFLIATLVASWILVVVVDKPVNRFRQARVHSRC